MSLCMCFMSINWICLESLMLYCASYFREILGADFDGGFYLNKLFKGLESNSVLFVLNETGLFKSLKYEEVIELLEKQPFLQDDNKSCRRNMNEINMVLCFTILKRFTNLIIGSISGVLIEQDGINVPYTNILAKTYVEEIKLDIVKIEPVALRVEILENIFSLLFVRRSDIKDQEQEDIDYDNIEEVSMNSSSMSRSVDSLITTVDEVTDTSKSSSLRSETSLVAGTSVGVAPSKRDLFPAKVDNDVQQFKDQVMEALLQEIEESSTDTLKENKKEKASLQSSTNVFSKCCHFAGSVIVTQ